MRAPRPVLACLAALALRCNDPNGATSATELCAIGWWSTDEHPCFAAGCPVTRPCGYGECARMQMLHLGADHRASRARVDWSRVFRYVEQVETPESGTWRMLSATRIEIQLPSGTLQAPARCDAMFLLHGSTGYARIFAPANWDRAEQTGRWTRQDPEPISR